MSHCDRAVALLYAELHMQALLLRFPLVFSAAAGSLPVRRPRIEPTETDGELVRRARQGNRWAEEALYHRHVRSVMRIVLRLLARNSEAEDVVQDAFVTALGQLDKLRDEEAFGGWLLRIAVHQVHRRFRRRRLLRALGLDRAADDVTLAEHMDPQAGPDVRAGLAEIDRLLETLPGRTRVAWILRHVEGQELREVARTCDCSLATAKRLLGRAESVISAHVRLEPMARDDV